MPQLIRLFAAGLLVLSLLSTGCASRTTTVKTQERVRYPAAAAEPTPEPVVVEQQSTTTTVSTTSQAPRGILSTAVHVVGEIIALPFRLIGGLLRLIF